MGRSCCPSYQQGKLNLAKLQLQIGLVHVNLLDRRQGRPVPFHGLPPFEKIKCYLWPLYQMETSQGHRRCALLDYFLDSISTTKTSSPVVCLDMSIKKKNLEGVFAAINQTVLLPLSQFCFHVFSLLCPKCVLIHRGLAASLSPLIPC